MARRPLLAMSVLAALLAGCGFRPLYGDYAGDNVQKGFDQIIVSPVDDRGQQYVYNALRYSIAARTTQSRASGTPYQLNFQAVYNVQSLIITRAEVATRFNVMLDVQYQLIERASGNVMTAGKVTSFAPYNVTQADFANLTAERDARERAARDASEQIRTRLALYFERAIPSE